MKVANDAIGKRQVSISTSGTKLISTIGVLLATFCCLISTGSAQTPATAWLTTYDGPGNGSDVARSVAVDASGNVYVYGWSYGGPATDTDLVVISLDSAGQQQWVYRYDGPDHKAERFRFQSRDQLLLRIDGSGNVLIAGMSWHSGRDYDYVTIKLLPTGDTAWVRTYNGSSNGTDAPMSLALDAAGNSYVTGFVWYTSQDFATIKYRPDGSTAWVAIYDDSLHSGDIPYSVRTATDGSVYVAGAISYFNPPASTWTDWFVVKYDSLGSEMWHDRHNGFGNIEDAVCLLELDRFENLIAAGWSTGLGTEWDIQVAKYRPNGDTAWMRTFDGAGHRWDAVNGLDVDRFGSVYISGYTYLPTGNPYSLIQKYDSSGVLRWSQVDSIPNWVNDRGYQVKADTLGRAYVAVAKGFSAARGIDLLVARYSDAGAVDWEVFVDTGYYNPDYSYAIALLPDGHVIAAGAAQPASGTGEDMLCVKYNTVLLKSRRR